MTITDFLLYFHFFVFHEFLKIFCFYDMCHQFFEKESMSELRCCFINQNIKILLQKFFFKNFKTKQQSVQSTLIKFDILN